MTFLQPYILWALPLILLPVIIHLLNRMRHRTQQWAAMRFLISATRSSVSNAKLRQFLILLCRVLAVAALILFLARPLAGGWLGWALSPAPDVIVLLLDRSASMEAVPPNDTETKRERAVRLLSETAKTFADSSHFVLIDSALRTPQEISNPKDLKELSATGATDTAADIPSLLQSAANWLIENRAGTTEIWIASDLQASSWHPEDSRWKSVLAQLSALPQKVRVRLLALNQGESKNSSIEIRELVRRAQGDQSELRFVIDLQRNNSSSDPVSITLNLDGVSSQLDIPMEGQAMRWRHKVMLPAGKARGWGSFSLPADANRRDNSAFFVFGAETKTEAIVVSEDANSSRFLRLAASSVVNRSLVQPKVIIPAEAEKEDWAGASLIVWKAPLPGAATGIRLERFVQEGGAVLFVPPGATDSGRFHGIGWGAVEAAPPDKPFHVLRWDENQGPLAKTDEGFSLPLTQVQFQRRQRLDGKLSTLAAFEDGTPFLARLALGKGEVFFAGSLPSSDWSTLSEGPVFVPMMQRLLFAGARRLQQVSSITSGELNPVVLQKKWEPVEAGLGRDIRTAAGVYRSGEDLLASNRPSSEDDIEVLDLNEARPLFGDLSLQLLQDNRSRSDRLQGEIWRMLLILMLLFLIGEGLLILPPKIQGNDEKEGRKPERRESEAMSMSK